MPPHPPAREPPLRIRPDKIRDLAEQVVEMVEANPKLSLNAPHDAVRVAVASAIRSNLEEEDDIDREVDALMREHGRQIEQQDMDAEQLRHKFKTQIARQRGFTL